MYGKNTLDKIYLTQKNYSPIPLPPKGGKLSSLANPLAPQRGNSSSFQERIAIPSEAKRRIVIPSETKGRIAIRPYSSPLPVPCSLLTDPCSLFYVKNLL